MFSRLYHDQFKLGSAELLPDSFGLLDEVAGVMRDNSQIERVQIEGHTDSTGSAKINKKLSKERAESVRSYLVKKGIEDGRWFTVRDPDGNVVMICA